MYFKPEWYRLTAGEVIAFVIRRRVYKTTTTLLLSRLYSDIIMNSYVNENNCSVQLSVFCVKNFFFLIFIFMNSLPSLLHRWNPAYQTSASDVPNLGIWRTKPRHLTLQTLASDVPNIGIWRTKPRHLTYQTSASDVPNLDIWNTVQYISDLGVTQGRWVTMHSQLRQFCLISRIVLFTWMYIGSIQPKLAGADINSLLKTSIKSAVPRTMVKYWQNDFTLYPMNITCLEIAGVSPCKMNL